MAEPVTSRPSALDQADDIAGPVIAYCDNDLTRNDVNEAGDPAIGRIQASATGDGTFSAPSGIQATLTVATGTPFASTSVGDVILIENSTTSSNDGAYLIITFTSSTVVDVERLDSATTVVAEGGADWYHGLPYSGQTMHNNHQTDRCEIKMGGSGTTNGHQADMPTYQRPDAVGTDIKGSIWNLTGQDAAVNATWPANTFGVTLDSKAEICEIVFTAVDMSDASALGDSSSSTTSGDLTAGSGTPFTSAMVGRVLTLTGTNAGDWVITAFVSSTVVTLRQLNGSGAPADDTGITWTMYSDRRVVNTSVGYADATDRTGIPVADSGAQDETNYEANYVFVMSDTDPSGRAGFVNTSGAPVYGRAYQALEGTDVLIQFITGPNTGAATAHNWESGGTPDDNDPTAIYLQVPNRQRLDQLDETCRRKVLQGGILSDAEIVHDINQLNEYTGRSDGETDTTWTNNGNYYALQGCATNLEAGVNCLNDAIGDRDYSTALESFGCTDGDTITAALNCIADELADVTLDRFVYLVTTTINKFGTLSLSSFAGAPATYEKSSTGANCWLFVRGLLWHVGTIAQKGQYEEGADLGGGTANEFTVNSKLNTDDWADVMIK